MQANIKQRDVVALTAALPEHGLVCGQVGAVVQILAPGVYEVEFSDEQGRTYAEVALRDTQFMILHFEPQPAT